MDLTQRCKAKYFFFNHIFLFPNRSEQDIILPEPGKYATGMMFIDGQQLDEVQTEFTKMATKMQLEVGI